MYLRPPFICTDGTVFGGKGPGHSFDYDPALPQNTADRGPMGPPGPKLFGPAQKEQSP